MTKKDGKLCMCVDHRKLNAITRGDPYPLRNIEEMINSIGKSPFITTLDLIKGYYQVPVAEGSREKTAFVTTYGKYQFRTVPFGLVTAPSTFQRLMDHVLEGIHQFTTAYLDDVLIHSATWEEHLHHLTTVFQRLRWAGLHIKREKCSFAANKYVYLGHVVRRGVWNPWSVRSRLLRTISNLTPKNKSDHSSCYVDTIGSSYQTFPLSPTL